MRTAKNKYIYMLVIFSWPSILCAQTQSDKNTDSISAIYNVKSQEITALSEPNNITVNTENTEELGNLLQEINKLNFPKQKYIEQADRNIGKIEPEDAGINSAKKEDSHSNISTVKKPAKTKIEYTNKDVAKILNAITTDDEKIQNPLTLAKIAFSAGFEEQAARFYKISLIRLKSTDTFYNENRAWLIFQLGNCYRSCDFKKALSYYNQLIEEYPNSTWAPFAKLECELARMYDSEIDMSLLNIPEVDLE